MDKEYVNNLLYKHMVVETAIMRHILRYNRITQAAVQKIYDKYKYMPEEYERIIVELEDDMMFKE